MTYIANKPNCYEDEEELTRILREAGFKVYTGHSVERAIRRKEKLIELRGGGCEKCGYSKNRAVLDFHHPAEKGWNVSKATHEWTDEQFEDILIPEVKNNTVLLCANCHREEHN